MANEKIDYGYWQKVIFGAQIGMAICLFVVEVIVNTMLYVTRSQGYGPDTIVEKLIRYQLLTTVFDIVVIFACRCLCKMIEDNHKKKYILTIAMIFICLNVSFSHYQFAPTFLVFLIPLIFTIMYEDKKMCDRITVINLLVLLIPVIARGSDAGYNADIGPEAIISAALIILINYFCKKIIAVMVERRLELHEALIQAEKSKFVDVLNTKNQELEQLSRETFESIALAIDANDPYTAGHSRRVAEYSKMIASQMNFDEAMVEEIFYAGLIHDVGKIGIDNSIINKPCKLNDMEFEEIKRHPISGYNILKGISIRGNFAHGAKWHHERIDGKGYPDGLKGDDIPIIAKIIAVADAYDAMTSKRAYRDVMEQSKVREQIVKGKGTQFDEKIADIMISLIDADVHYDMKQKA